MQWHASFRWLPRLPCTVFLLSVTRVSISVPFAKAVSNRSGHRVHSCGPGSGL